MGAGFSPGTSPRPGLRAVSPPRCSLRFLAACPHTLPIALPYLGIPLLCPTTGTDAAHLPPLKASPPFSLSGGKSKHSASCSSQKSRSWPSYFSLLFSPCPPPHSLSPPSLFLPPDPHPRIQFVTKHQTSFFLNLSNLLTSSTPAAITLGP